ncbi:putative phage tail protein [Mannheimia haemolytica]|uniref:putative phage tail protein n=1 Tax=Mannheimia haemolytica TaxID=75985 RepID=UPI0032096F15
MAITHEQYLDAAVKLLPVGLAWKRALDSHLAKVLAVRCEQLVTVNTQAHALVKERMPGKATLLLEDWESFFGLPEAGRQIVGKTIAERQAQVKEKEEELGSSSKIYLEEAAKRAGYQIEIVNYYPHHCLRDCMYPLYEYQNAWRIFIYTEKLPTNPTDEVDRNQELQEILKRYSNADVEMVFMYKDTP